MNKILMVKEIRERTGCGLHEAILATETSNENCEKAIEMVISGTVNFLNKVQITIEYIENINNPLSLMKLEEILKTNGAMSIKIR